MVKVSVLLATYNHCKFIHQALDGAINQQTNFAYEILVGEDFSTDGTRAIVEEYAKKYPNLIRAFFHQQNIGGHVNLDNLIRSARGEYLAWLEGDDYWTDTCKLAKQVDILENDKSLVISFHRVSIVSESGVELRDSERYYQPKTITNMRNLIRNNYIYTPSCMYRNHVVDLTPTWIHQLALGDWPRHLLLSQHGKIHYLRDKMAAYREVQTGVWHSRGAEYQHIKSLEMIRMVDRHTPHRYDLYFKLSYLKLYVDLISLKNLGENECLSMGYLSRLWKMLRCGMG